jgi:hypothetical protein
MTIRPKARKGSQRDMATALDRLYRAVLRTTSARIAEAHPDEPGDYELQQAICEAERALGIA